MGHPFALDYGSVMMVAAARGADVDLVAELLPIVEPLILAGLQDAGPEPADGAE